MQYRKSFRVYSFVQVMKQLGIKLTVQMEKSDSDAEHHGETRVLQQYALHRLRIEVEEYECYMDTITSYMDEETINDMRLKELKPDYVVDIVVAQPDKKKKKTPAVDPSSVKWVFRMGDDGQAKSDPEHLPVWYVLRAHYVECVCLRAHLSNVQENNGRVTLNGLDSFVSMKERLTFIRTHFAHTVELVEYVLVAHWEDLQNVAENITFEVCKKAGKKRTMWIDDGSKTFHISVTSADTALPDIDAFVLQRLREQIEVSEQTRETVTDLRERTQEFAKKLGEELGGDMAVGTIQEDDVIAGLSRESLIYLCPPSAILATTIVYQLPDMDRNVARACVVSSANQPSTLIWKWHIRVATNNTPDELRCLRFWIESERFSDTQKRDRLVVTRDGRHIIKAHVNPQESDFDEKLVLGRWESFSLVECVGSEGRQTAQRVDFVSCMGAIYRTTRGVDDFVEHLPNVLNVGWEAKDKSVAELDALRGDVLMYANDHFRWPPLLFGPVVQAFNMKDHRLEIATHLLLEKLANIERHLTAYTFCKVNIEWTSWSRFAKEDGLARLAIFTLLTTVDRLEAAVDTTMGQLEEPVEGLTEDMDHKSPYFFQNVTIHFHYDPSVLGDAEKQVAEASPWTLVKSGSSLIVSCKKVIFEDESEIGDISSQAQRYADIGTYEECPFFRGLQSLTDTVKNDQLKHALGQNMTRLAEGLTLDNVSLTLAATVPSLSTPKEFEVLHHPDLPGDVMAQYSSRLEQAMEPFLDAVSFISASGAGDNLQQIKSVEVILPHADDTSRTYGITFQKGVLQYTLSTPSHHTKSLLPSRYMLNDAILFALKIKPKWSDKQTRDISAQETSVSEQSLHGLQLPLLGSQNVFSLEFRNTEGDLLSQAEPVKDGNITVSVLHDSETISCQSSTQGQTNGTVRVSWTLPSIHHLDAGCLVDVRWRGDPVKGSPFPAALIPPDESRHRALGRGRLVGQADGVIQAGSTWHQLVYHRPHGCRSLTELGQFVRKKEMEQSGRRMTPGKFVSKHHQWTHLQRSGWHVTRHPALHVYHHQVALDAQSTSPEEGVASTEQQRPETSKQRPVMSSLIPSFSVTELANGHLLLRCRSAQVGTFETRMLCPVCREELQTVSTTHSLLQTARVIVMPGRISARTSYVEGACLQVA